MLAPSFPEFTDELANVTEIGLDGCSSRDDGNIKKRWKDAAPREGAVHLQWRRLTISLSRD